MEQLSFELVLKWALRLMLAGLAFFVLSTAWTFADKMIGLE